MSAIFGLYCRDGGQVSCDTLEKIDHALARLGPDGHGMWLQGHVGLGFRLMCFTPEDRFEQQPCIGGDGKIILVFDGRIDNRPELIEMLGLQRGDAKNLPDSALVLFAFEKWGQDCPSRLIGPFAFVVWDARTDTLFAARTPFAGPPLYYHLGTRVLAFCTRPKGIYASHLLRRRVDEEYLADYLVSFPSEPDRTFFQDITLLAPGQCLIAHRSGVRLRKYWNLDQVQQLRFARDGDYVDAAKGLLDRVVADHLRSLTPIGVLLSGGLDSTTIAASAAVYLKAEGKDLAAFTEVPKPDVPAPPPPAGRYGDETSLVKATAALHDNLALNFVHGDGFYLRDVDDFFDAVELPFRNASNRCWIEACLRGAAAQGRQVVLTGGGGNLSLGRSDDGMLTAALRSWQVSSAWQTATQMARAKTARSALRALVAALMPLTPLVIRRAHQRRKHGWPVFNGGDVWAHYSAINKTLLESTRVEERGRGRGFNFEFATTLDARSLRLLTLDYSQITVNIDRGYRELFQSDTRHPAYDQRLIEFSFALPERQFLHRGVPRALIRRVAVGRVPSAVVENRRRGLQNAQWLAHIRNARDEIHATLERFRRSPLVCHAIDVPKLQALARRLPTVDPADRQTDIVYRSLFEIGMMTGSFLLWVESRG